MRTCNKVCQLMRRWNFLIPKIIQLKTAGIFMNNAAHICMQLFTICGKCGSKNHQRTPAHSLTKIFEPKTKPIVQY